MALDTGTAANGFSLGDNSGGSVDTGQGGKRREGRVHHFGGHVGRNGDGFSHDGILGGKGGSRGRVRRRGGQRVFPGRVRGLKISGLIDVERRRWCREGF